MENKSYLFTTGFNQNFNIIENCKIISPPYVQGYKGDKFFVKKRDGVNIKSGFEGDSKNAVIYSDLSNEYSIIYIDDKIIKEDLTTIVSGVDTNKIHEVELPGGSLLYNGTASSGSATTLVDTSATWTVNEFSGMYLYLEDGTGAGDYQPILGNDATTITVVGFTAGLSPDDTTSYRVYDQVVKTFGYSDFTDNKSYFYDGNQMIEVKTISFDSNTKINTLSSDFANRRWFTDNNRKLYYSYEGQPLIIEGYLNTFGGKIIDIKGRGEYLVVFQEKKLIVVKKEFDNNNTLYFTTKDLVDVSLYSENSILIYNGGLYFIAGDKHLYSLNVEINNSEIKGSITLQTKDLAPYIDKLTSSSYITYTVEYNDGFAFGFNGGITTTEFYYSKVYEGWLTNKYEVGINGIQILKGVKTYLSSAGVGENKELSGDNELDFEQRIGFTIGDDTSYYMKKIKAFKSLFGKTLTGTTCKMIVDGFTSYKTELHEKEFEGIKYIEDQNINAHPLGDAPLGETLFGGEDSKYYVLADVGIVMNFYNKMGYIFNIILTDSKSGNGFTYGGTHVLYEPQNPMMHGLKNTL